MDEGWAIFLIFLLVVMIVVGGVIAYSAYYGSSTDTFCDIVTDKWITPNGETTKYLVSTANHGVLENTDSAWAWKYDSSDVYAKIKVGTEQCFKTMGWRIPWLSEYKNIIEVTNK